MRSLFKRNNHINKDDLGSIEYIPLQNKPVENKKAQKTPTKGHSLSFERLEIPIFQARFYEILFTVSIIVAGLFLRTVYLQIIKGREYSAVYESLHHRREWILAPRGLINDRNGATLAYNIPGQNPNEFKRFYPDGELFSSIIGYVGRIDAKELYPKNIALPGQGQDAQTHLPFDLVGKSGVESSYENFLAGVHGKIEKSMSAKGDSLQAPLVSNPKPGDTLTLTVDASMQKALTGFLKEKMTDVKSKAGAAVVINPRNGEIVSLISLPSFDNNAITPELLEDNARPLFNRALAGEYPPGSAIKPFMASAALNEHIISPTRIIKDEGKIFISSAFDPSVTWIFKSWKALGPVDMRRALALSSNIYFYTVGGGYKDIQGLGIERMKTYLERFGFGAKSGIDIPGEQQGFIGTPAWKQANEKTNWYIGDTYNTAIGQGYMRVTPLQLALATTVVANKGTIYTPHVLKEVKNEEGKIIFSYQPKPIKEHIVPEEYFDIVRDGMRLAVKEGTVYRLSSLGVDLGAKTGTAQAGIGFQPHAWVTLFMPFDNPQIVVTILLEHGIGGEQSAVPVAKKFLEWYLQENPNLKT